MNEEKQKAYRRAYYEANKEKWKKYNSKKKRQAKQQDEYIIMDWEQYRTYQQTGTKTGTAYFAVPLSRAWRYAHTAGTDYMTVARKAKDGGIEYDDKGV